MQIGDAEGDNFLYRGHIQRHGQPGLLSIASKGRLSIGSFGGEGVSLGLLISADVFASVSRVHNEHMIIEQEHVCIPLCRSSWPINSYSACSIDIRMLRVSRGSPERAACISVCARLIGEAKADWPRRAYRRSKKQL